MSNASKKLMGTTSAAGGFTAIEDVFSTYLYTGNGSTQTITNGIDLANEGGLVWLKQRTGAGLQHVLYDTERGSNSALFSSLTNSAVTSGGSFTTAFNSDGFITDTSGGNVNNSGLANVSWTFRKAPRFFDVVTWTGNGTSQTVAHNLGIEPAVIMIKCIDIARKWNVFTDVIDGTIDYLVLNDTIAAADGSTLLTKSSASFNLLTNATDFNGDGFTYVAYLYAHDPLGPSGDGSDGLISCGSVLGGAEVNLGWEPQWVLAKATNLASNWFILDTMRGFTGDTVGSASVLRPNESSAETINDRGYVTSKGFVIKEADGFPYIYIAIRRGPMKVPESGTEVFAVDTMAGFTLPSWKSGFPVDMNFWRSKTSAYNWELNTRITNSRLFTNLTSAESAISSNGEMDYSNGFGSNTSTDSQYQAWMFRRAPNFFDVVAYTGDGTLARAVPHNLGVAPEWVIFKTRNSVEPWYNYHAGITSPNANWWLNYLQLESTQAANSSDSFDEPDANNINLSSNGFFNGGGKSYIAYLFATLAGVSKVGSYTGNGSSQTINCGFTTGARFILIKRTDSTSDWYVWDTARGIVAANDPHLSLNTTAAEITTDDSVDPDSSGFIVNQVAATNINVSSASYIFYAIA